MNARLPILTFIVFGCWLAAAAEGEELTEQKNTQIVPLAQYEQLNLSTQSVQSISAGLAVQNENLMFMSIYSGTAYEAPLTETVGQRLYSFETMIDGRVGRHQYIASIQTESDQPLSFQWSDLQAGVAYGYEIIAQPNLSVVAGGGFAYGDFGIETSNGENWPLIPIPLLRVHHSSDIAETTFEFLTSPSLSFTLAPKNKVRLVSDIRFDQLRDSRDIIFETALHYRFFSADHEYGDFAGIAVGIKNDHYGSYKLMQDVEPAELQYMAAFAAVDITLLKLTTGYAFNSRTYQEGKNNQQLGEGFYFSVQGLFAF